MVLRRRFETDLGGEEVLTRAGNWLASNGFRLVSRTNPDLNTPELYFERASPLMSFLAFSPRHWGTTGFVRFEPHQDKIAVCIEFQVQHWGQILTKLEFSFWKATLVDLETFILNRESEANNLKRLEARMVRVNIAYVAFGLVLLTLLVIYAPDTFSILGMLMVVVVLIVLGIVSGLVWDREFLV